MKRIQCREHGGYFMVEPRRGRPPVRCTEENQCDAQRVPTGKVRTPGQRLAAELPDRYAPVVGPSKTRTLAATPVNTSASDTAGNVSWEANRRATLKECNRIFHEVVALGWETKRGWVNNTTAEITATRGEEMLYVVIKAGIVIQQDYSLWSFDKPSTNGKPKSNLPFDPDEIGDRELAQYLVGNKVTWYNRLSGKEETGFCGKESIHVEHGYNVRGDEMPGERIIKFIDADELHFRAFRLDSLLKVGK